MTLLRKVCLAALATIATFGLLKALVLAQAVQPLYWPAVMLRIVLLAAMGPALLVVHWTDLHWGHHPPLGLCYFALWLTYLHFGNRLRGVLRCPTRLSRRAFFLGTGAVAAAGCGAPMLYPAPRVLRRDLPLKDLPESLLGTRVVLVSDLHRGPVISREYLESVVGKINRLKPDLVLMPGDFVSRSDSYFPDVTAVLSRLQPTIASVATLGNHDNWEGAEQAQRALSQAGVMVLHNRSVHLDPDRRIVHRGKRGLCLAGVDDLGSGRPDLKSAFGGVPSNVPRILLSHNPDLAEDEESLKLNARVDLQVSGHTHGGQIVLPGIGPLVSGSRHGLKYIAGWVEGPQWPVFVSRGVGTSIIPVRVGADPEIVLFTLTKPV